MKEYRKEAEKMKKEDLQEAQSRQLKPTSTSQQLQITFVEKIMSLTERSPKYDDMIQKFVART